MSLQSRFLFRKGGCDEKFIELSNNKKIPNIIIPDKPMNNLVEILTNSIKSLLVILYNDVFLKEIGVSDKVCL
ncbi:hypothetical protein M2372_004365 [Chryseobacterium sp. BIGb0232]|nr:hypothetical protein [Chryseobacterium sp. BIGb0232]ROS09692.1 hypothetical protein EDF65_4434 [Chryseobacterium nakagawai]